MKAFLAVFLGTASTMEQWNALPEQERQARGARGVEAWHAWVDRHRDAIVDAGGPLGRTKAVSAAGVADLRNAMTAYTTVRAASHEDAARMFENHPHFTIFPGDSIEVMEVLPIPPR